MATREDVEGFLAQRSLALAGASRSGKKFGNTVLKELRARGYEVFVLHPEAESIDGLKCASSLADLPKKVEALLCCVPPVETEKLVREAAGAGVRRVWLQPGAESAAALDFCRENGISVVAGQCLMLHSEPVNGVHRFHRWLWRLFGKGLKG